MNFRIGEGWDIHALVPGRRLVLGGIEIAHHSGLLGHSDADALLHAITDAVLGAAALGDIGSAPKATRLAISIAPSLPKHRVWPRTFRPCAKPSHKAWACRWPTSTSKPKLPNALGQSGKGWR